MRLRLSVCIPTYNRPAQVGELLENLLAQQRLPDEVVIVDSSPDEATRMVTAAFAARLPIIYEHFAKGLTRQRNRAIELAGGEIVVFLDDDVLLEPPFLARVEEFFAGDSERRIGGVTGVQINIPVSAKGPTWKLKRLLGIIETDVDGRLLDCGEATPLPRPATGERARVDYLPGGLTAWRREVFASFRFSTFFSGYGLGEDKYFSAATATCYELYVDGSIEAQHLHVTGNRPDYLRWGYYHVFNHCFIMRECRTGPLRWPRLIAFHAIDILDDLCTWPLRTHRRRTLLYGIGRLLGLFRSLVAPPQMGDDDPAQANRAYSSRHRGTQ